MSGKGKGQMNIVLPGLDENAFCRLYDNCREDLYRYAYYKLGSREDAEDAVQDCVLEAWRGLSGLRRVEAFRGWIFKILAASCNRRIRGIIKEREKKDAVRQQEMPVAESAGEQAERNLALGQALAQLTEEERDIVLLSAVAGLTSAQIAEQTGLQPGSVRSKLSRSLARMRKHLT